MQNLTGLDEIAFTGAFRFELDPAKNPGVPPRTPRLLETPRETAVLFALNRSFDKDFTDLVLAFPLVNARGDWQTTWPKELSFPVFLRNVLFRLGNVSDSAAEQSVSAGDVKIVRPGGPIKEIQVKGARRHDRRDDSPQSASSFRDQQHRAPRHLRGKLAGRAQAFAVNLLDLQESNIQPRDAVQVGSQSLPAGPSRGQPRETWKWWAVIALGLLTLEWVFYHRRYG